MLPTPRAPVIDPQRAAENNSTAYLIVISIFWGLAFVTACVRFYTRAVVVRSFGRDDVFMVLAVLCAVAGLASWIVECRSGFGRHQDTIPRAEFVSLMEAQFYQSIIEASFAFGFLKISIALSLLRLSRGSWYNRILWTLIAFTCFYTLFAFVTILTVCRPIAGQWDASLRPKCYSRLIYRDFGLFNAACNIFTDVAFATLPVPLIWSLQLQRRIRLYLIAILSGGYFAVALGIVKAIFIIAYVRETDGTFFPGAPFFGSLQLDIGIIAACAPTLRPLLGRALHLSTSLDPYRGANYYRAGKALDRLPRPPVPAAARRYLHGRRGGGRDAGDVDVEGDAEADADGVFHMDVGKGGR
ncbi:bfa84ac6-2afd-4b6a-a33f-eab4edb327b3 [Thermothielavioides terrestris]|uniref:Bfa84ac6-2afd-4b6a-a33f-eab4edb327b3 n=1 Tax=Thermothielavioides terrestris TaxID=2587410 RepID=A0A446BTC0_9PEZI|nr:bfa84ac6-2afd-4b6a-a33f-eab4edb327b3 [Thermothielavioides terrestris]